MDDHFITMAKEIGEINGTVQGLTNKIDQFIEANQKMHDDHRQCCTENKVAIGKINARHGTYWKVISSFGGLGALGAFFAKFSGN